MTDHGSEVAPPAEASGTLPPERVQAMFNRIARPYDVMNRVMTAGLDKRWRRLAAQETEVGRGASVLDCCCGTGELALELARMVGPAGEVIGVDFAEEMLVRARQKAVKARFQNATFVQGDALSLPLPDDRVAAATVAFGVRNLADYEAGFRELVRVVRPGGRIVCLEITTPESGPLAPLSRAWFERAVPALGRVADPDGDAYDYLPASVQRFPSPDALGELMFRAGLVRVRYRTLAAGIIALHVGEVRTR